MLFLVRTAFSSSTACCFHQYIYCYLRSVQLLLSAFISTVLLLPGAFISTSTATAFISTSTATALQSSEAREPGIFTGTIATRGFRSAREHWPCPRTF